VCENFEKVCKELCKFSKDLLAIGGRLWESSNLSKDVGRRLWMGAMGL
jgi:hypothetical protein